MSKPKERYAVIGIIASITDAGRKPVIIRMADAMKFLDMRVPAKKMVTLTEAKDHLDQNFFASKIDSLKHDIFGIAFEIAHEYGFTIDLKFDSATGNTVMFLNQDGYTFDISEVLSI